MTTNKELAFRVMREYAEQLAHKYGLKTLVVNKNDFWGDYGEDEYVWTGDNDNDCQVDFRTRFGNPRIDVRIFNTVACVELSQGYRKVEDNAERDGIYRPSEVQAFYAGGLVLANEMWDYLSKAVHEPTTEFYE